MLSDPSQLCEVIFFTEDERIMERIDEKDWVNDIVAQEDMEEAKLAEEVKEERPMTATRQFNQNEIDQMKRASKAP